MTNQYPRLHVTIPNWPTKDEAQPRIISFKDRAVLVYISENQELTVEFDGDFKLEQMSKGVITVTLESDL